MIIVVAIFLVGLLIYKELNKDTVIIEPFQVPLDLEKQNITGQAIVNKLIDQIEDIKSHADTSYKNFNVTPLFYDTQLEIVIPGSGISLKSLLLNVKNFLGRKQTRITGEVVLNKKLFLTIRVQGEPSKTFSGEIDDLDNILGEAAKYVLKFTQPYILAFYLYYNYGNNKEEALEMIRYSLTHAPKDDDPMAYTLWGYITWEEGNFDESIKYYKKAIELDPKYIDAYNGWAYSLYDEGKYEEAEEIYKKAYKLDPKYAYTSHYWGMNMEAQGKIDSAVMMYEKAIELDPSYDEVQTSYGEILTQQKKYDDATVHFDKAIELNPNSSVAFAGLANVFYKQNKYSEALDMFNKSIELNPKYTEAYTGAGEILSEEKKFKEANEMYRKAIELKPSETELYMKLASNLVEQKKYPEAIDIYNRVKVINPSDSVLINQKIDSLK